ncbi:MAG: type IVB secretion system protein IcmM/DotJ [Legionella sp.]|uniref:type IVB secretion system protein IcmM/DotJ n=1 Tax=Legionella sp. TaxID=459 RepID=UPI0039E55487
MNRESWNLIKSNKNFDVNVYRRGLIVLILSLILNTILGLLLFYIYITVPERDYYATNGVTPPVKLTPMASANMSSTALLAPEPPPDNVEKMIPQ